MMLGEIKEQIRQLCDLVGLLGEDPNDCVIKAYGHDGSIHKLVIEMSEQTIVREWKSWTSHSTE